MGCGASYDKTNGTLEGDASGNTKAQSADSPPAVASEQVSTTEAQNSALQPAVVVAAVRSPRSQSSQPCAVAPPKEAVRDPPEEGSLIEKASSTQALRSRFSEMASTFSLEVAPGDVEAGLAGAGPPGKGPKKLLTYQSEAVDAGKQPLLKSGTRVYVNMVKTTMAHFDDVQAASKALHDAGLSPVPHLPAARFETADDCHSTVNALAGVGAGQLLVIGGNDLQQQLEAKACAYVTGACGLLDAELPALQAAGIHTIALAGHPDGHPGLAWDPQATLTALVQKARAVLSVGLNVVVATQFCFDARRLIRWLQTTRKALRDLRAEIPTAGTVSFHIGLPGPTSKKKLERIASICEVPSLFISSAFEVVDGDNDGFVSLDELLGAAEMLGISKRSSSKMVALYQRHADDKGLKPEAFSQLLVDDVVERCPSRMSVVRPQAKAAVVSGPSAFVADSGGSAGKSLDPPVAPIGSQPAETVVVWPEELVITLATFCDRENTSPGEVTLHFFPFGGLAKTFDLISKLQDGSWPKLSQENEGIEPVFQS